MALESGVDLYWIPLGAGAGGALVRWSGRAYERLTATLGRRRPCDLYHSALEVTVDGTRTSIEMAPVWTKTGERGVVLEGPVGLRALGRWPAFRYELRCWTGGSIPDLAAALDGAHRVSADRAQAVTLLALAHEVPRCTWGRDELHTGEMWNSNSVVSWLLARSGHDLQSIRPPAGGRAPGWDAGRTVASAAPRRE